MWEINECDTKFLYTVDKCHQKSLDLRIGSIVHLGTWHYSLKVPALDMKVSALGTSTYKYVARDNHKHTLIFLKSMVNEHRIHRSQELCVTH